MSQEIADHLSYAVAYSPMLSTSYAGGKLVTQHARTEAAVLYSLSVQAQSRTGHSQPLFASEHAHIGGVACNHSM